MEKGEKKVDFWEVVAVDQATGQGERSRKRRDLEGGLEETCFLL